MKINRVFPPEVNSFRQNLGVARGALESINLRNFCSLFSPAAPVSSGLPPLLQLEFNFSSMLALR